MKLSQLNATILATTNWCRDSSKNFLLFLFNPEFSCKILPLVQSRSGIFANSFDQDGILVAVRLSLLSIFGLEVMLFNFAMASAFLT